MTKENNMWSEEETVNSGIVAIAVILAMTWGTFAFKAIVTNLSKILW